jgi:uncharacterized membrane protein
MNFFRYALLWALSFIMTSLIDAVWHLGFFGKIYKEGIKPLARMNGDKMAFHPVAGIISQVLVVSCIFFLVLYKVQKGTAGEAFLVGAAAGILAVTVYGITNYALFKDWGLAVTLLEMAWGPFLGGLSGLFIFWLKPIIVK